MVAGGVTAAFSVTGVLFEAEGGGAFATCSGVLRGHCCQAVTANALNKATAIAVNANGGWRQSNGPGPARDALVFVAPPSTFTAATLGARVSGWRAFDETAKTWIGIGMFLT